MGRVSRIMFWIVLILTSLWFQSGACAALKVGVAYTSRSGMSERVLKGFLAEMRSMGIELQMTYRTELADLDKLAEAVKVFERTQDAIIVMRSTGARWLAKHPTRIPTFVAACNNPEQLGVIKNMAAPEGNITGVTYYLPRKTQWEIFRAILPKADSILLLLEKGHPSSAIDLKETREVCSQLGIGFQYKICGSLEQAMAAIARHRNKVNAFVLGTQALYIDNTDKLVKRFPDQVFLSYSEKLVENGALGGFVADDFLLGRKLAVSVRDVLIKGKPIRQVPVKFDDKPKFLLNVQAAERLGVKIPFEILRTATLINEKGPF